MVNKSSRSFLNCQISRTVGSIFNACNYEVICVCVCTYINIFMNTHTRHLPVCLLHFILLVSAHPFSSWDFLILILVHQSLFPVFQHHSPAISSPHSLIKKFRETGLTTEPCSPPLETFLPSCSYSPLWGKLSYSYSVSPKLHFFSLPGSVFWVSGYNLNSHLFSIFLVALRHFFLVLLGCCGYLKSNMFKSIPCHIFLSLSPLF